jgi:hypothetical protein
MIANHRVHRVVLGLGVCIVLAGQTLAADVYQGTAKFKNADGKQDTAKVTISLEKATPEAERLALVEKVRGKSETIKSVLATQPQLGYIEARDRRVPIRYAEVSTSLGGQSIRVLSDEPLGFIGGDKKNAKPKAGYDLTYVMITLKASGTGSGEMAPAAKVKWMESGAPAPDRYGDQIVWLEDFKKVAQP